MMAGPLTGRLPGIRKLGCVRRWWLRGATREFRKTPSIKEHLHYADRNGDVHCSTDEHPVRQPFNPFDRSRL